MLIFLHLLMANDVLAADSDNDGVDSLLTAMIQMVLLVDLQRIISIVTEICTVIVQMLVFPLVPMYLQ